MAILCRKCDSIRNHVNSITGLMSDASELFESGNYKTAAQRYRQALQLLESNGGCKQCKKDLEFEIELCTNQESKERPE